MDVRLLFSRHILSNRYFIWLLFWVNLAGTVYGYMWYDNQLAWTAEHMPGWMLVFVPDSPTASLFFTASLLYLLFPSVNPSKFASTARVTIEALGVVCSVKYGVWAVAIIVAGAMQGDVLEWQHYMLIVSHLGMAVEALLYLKFMKAGAVALTAATGWLLLNDTIDYTYEINPWLPDVLEDDRPAVRLFTYCLSLASLGASLIVLRFRRKREQE